MNNRFIESNTFSFVLYDIEVFPYVKELIIHFLRPQAMVISPLHPADGVHLYGHYHFYLQYDHLVSLSWVERVVDLLYASRVAVVRNFKSLLRYFCHYDCPEKGVQFDPSDLYVYGDIDISNYFI